MSDSDAFQGRDSDKISLQNRRLQAICERWKSAEQNILLAEQVSGEISVPAINELRYSGRHLIDALRLVSSFDVHDKRNQEKIEEMLRAAEEHATRAEYDAIDAILMYASILAKETRIYDDLRGDILGKIKKTRDKIIESRTSKYSRASIYRDIRKDVPKVISIIYEIEKDRNKLDRKRYTRSISMAFAIILAIISLVVSMFSIVN